MTRTPTLRDWATGLAGYIAEAYAMELPETIDMIASLTRVLEQANAGPHLARGAVPLRVREQCDHNSGLDRALGAEALGHAAPVDPPLLVPAAYWGEFAMEFVEAHRWSDSASGMMLWHQFTRVFDEHHLGRRPVVYLAVPLQQALPLDADALAVATAAFGA